MKVYSRSSPYCSVLQERKCLTSLHAAQKTYHLALDIDNWDGDYRVGDSVGILPENDPAEVDVILKKMGAFGDEEIEDRKSNEKMSLRYFLTHKMNLSRMKGGGNTSLHEFLDKNSLTPQECVAMAMPLLPRFYSIASSRKVFHNEIHLLVRYVHYHENGREKFGVGSRYLCDLAKVRETKISWYIQPSNHFTLPQNPDQSMIMVGTGTGLAPYRAFMQERVALQSLGRNWLFFGERTKASDFYYEPFWLELEKLGRLRLDAVFSRDGAEKTYVQHRMYERRKSLWSYLEEGACFYVCGDASRMAKDVEAMLLQIVKEEGNYSEEKAREYIQIMRKERRYLADVY